VLAMLLSWVGKEEEPGSKTGRDWRYLVVHSKIQAAKNETWILSEEESIPPPWERDLRASTETILK